MDTLSYCQLYVYVLRTVPYVLRLVLRVLFSVRSHLPPAGGSSYPPSGVWHLVPWIYGSWDPGISCITSLYVLPTTGPAVRSSNVRSVVLCSLRTAVGPPGPWPGPCIRASIRPSTNPWIHPSPGHDPDGGPGMWGLGYSLCHAHATSTHTYHYTVLRTVVYVCACLSHLPMSHASMISWILHPPPRGS